MSAGRRPWPLSFSPPLAALSLPSAHFADSADIAISSFNMTDKPSELAPDFVQVCCKAVQYTPPPQQFEFRFLPALAFAVSVVTRQLPKDTLWTMGSLVVFAGR
jgi:hypothetical protein